MNFFHTESKSKKKIFWGGGGVGLCVCVGGPKPICPFNFFEVGDITMP